MRKLLFALALCLLPTAAFAQNTTCSDRPQSDSSNACANTRFATGAAAKFAPGGANGSVQYNNNGVFGGINPLDVPRGGTGQQTFTSNLPLIGNGTGVINQGTVSGNTTTFGTTSGALSSGNCAKFDANGNIVDSGGVCASGGAVSTYDTVAALNAATVPAGVNSVATLGYYTRGDGGGTTYVRVASAPTLSCSQTSNAGVSFWDLPDRSKINVKWCGAKGDGSTADDTAIANSITALNTRGGTVYFPAGNYICASTTTPCINLLNKYGISFEGAGTANGSVSSTTPPTSSATALTFTGNSGSLIHLDGTEAISFNNINFTYTSTTYGGNLIDLRQASGGVVTSMVTFDNFRSGGVSSSAKGATLFNVGKTLKVYFNHGFVNNANFVFLGATTNDGTTFANGIFINDIWFDTGITVPVIAGGSGWEIRDCLWEPPRGDGEAIGIYTTARGVDGFIIANNNFDDATGTGTWINFASNAGYGLGVVTGLSITGNFFQGASNSINLTSTNGMSVTGNTFTQSGSVAFIFQTTSTHFLIYGNKYNGTNPVINATPSTSLVETNP